MFKFAVKNILRYKNRSIITMLVIMVSAFSTVLIVGFMQGMTAHMLDGFIKYQTSHIRITKKEYFEKERFMPLYESIENVSTIKNELEKEENVKMVTPTFHLGGFIAKDDTTIPISIIAFDLKNNSYTLNEKLIEGSIKERGIIIGENLIKRFDMKIGDKPMIVSSTAYDAINAKKPEIIGVSEFGISEFDKKTVFMDIETAQEITRLNNASTQIYITLYNEKYTDSVTKLLKSKYPEYEVQSYKAQMGSLYTTIMAEKNIISFIAIIIMFLGSLVIINSLVASIYERLSEIGMLKALGFSNNELKKMLLFEGTIFGLIGGGSGFILGLIFITYLSIKGFDISKMMTGVDLAIDTVVYPSINIFTALICVVVSVLIPALVSLIPAKMITKINPVDAINSRN